MPTVLDRSLTADWLVDRLAELTMLAPETIDPTIPFAAYGIDSVYVVSLCAEIHDEFGVDLGQNDLVTHPTVARLAKYLAEDTSYHGVG